jgi:hypothetical protein
MKKKITTLLAALAAVATLGVIPASAAPIQPVGGQFLNAQFSFGITTDRWGDGRFERRGGYHYYNGFRGHRERRPGWRHHRGFWFPPAAFSFGITIGPRYHHRHPVGLSRQHVRWCENRYISYRASDNSFQPYHGPRRQCVSPYFR